LNQQKQEEICENCLLFVSNELPGKFYCLHWKRETTARSWCSEHRSQDDDFDFIELEIQKLQVFGPEDYFGLFHLFEGGE
jgi:hypothetical protein